MSQLSNQDVGLRAQEVKASHSTQEKSRSDVVEKSGHFFKDVDGLVTGFINKEIRIPSTAFTPEMSFTTKEFFSNALIAINVMKQLKQRVSTFMELFSGGGSNVQQRKDYVKKRIEQACRSKEV